MTAKTEESAEMELGSDDKLVFKVGSYNAASGAHAVALIVLPLPLSSPFFSKEDALTYCT